jgi:hypothetical protein
MNSRNRFSKSFICVGNQDILTSGLNSYRSSWLFICCFVSLWETLYLYIERSPLLTKGCRLLYVNACRDTGLSFLRECVSHVRSLPISRQPGHKRGSNLLSPVCETKTLPDWPSATGRVDLWVSLRFTEYYPILYSLQHIQNACCH